MNGLNTSSVIKRVNAYGGAQNVTQSLSGFNRSNVSNGTDTVRTYRNEYYFPQYTYDCRIIFTNAYYTTGLVQTGPGNSVTLTSGFEYNGNTVQVTFNGQTSINVPNGGEVVSDPIPMDIPARSFAYTRHALTVTGGQFWGTPVLGGAASTFSNNGSDLTTGTGALANSGNGTNISFVSGITGSTYPKTSGSVFIAGNSIAAGTGDNYGHIQNIPIEGFIARALAGSNQTVSPFDATTPYSFVFAPVPGSTIAEWVNPSNAPSLLRSMSGNDYSICELGRNDITANGSTFAQMQVLLQQLWSQFAARGIPVYQTTLPPLTSSTNNWRDVSAQTVNGTEAVRLSVNAYIRTTPAPLSGYIEVANTVEVNASNVLTQNGGFWIIRTPGGVVTGTATSGTNTTLTDTTKTWTANQFGPLGSNYAVAITGGTGVGQALLIESNTTNTLTFNGSFSTAPDSTSTYWIYDAPTLDGNHGSPNSHAAMSVPVVVTASANFLYKGF